MFNYLQNNILHMSSKSHGTDGTATFVILSSAPRGQGLNQAGARVVERISEAQADGQTWQSHE